MSGLSPCGIYPHSLTPPCLSLSCTPPSLCPGCSLALRKGHHTSDPREFHPKSFPWIIEEDQVSLTLIIHQSICLGSPPITSNASRDRCGQSEGPPQLKIPDANCSALFTLTPLDACNSCIYAQDRGDCWLTRTLVRLFAVWDTSEIIPPARLTLAGQSSLAGFFGRSTSEHCPYLQTTRSSLQDCIIINPRSVERPSITCSRDQTHQRPGIFFYQSSAESLPHLPTF